MTIGGYTKYSKPFTVWVIFIAVIVFDIGLIIYSKPKSKTTLEITFLKYPIFWIKSLDP